MTINDRVQRIVSDLYNGNKSALAKVIGVNPSVIENIVGARQGKPSYEVLEKICANAKISPAWLILEEGEMLSKDSESQIYPFTFKMVQDMLAEKDATIRSLVELLGSAVKSSNCSPK